MQYYWVIGVCIPLSLRNISIFWIIYVCVVQFAPEEACNFARKSCSKFRQIFSSKILKPLELRNFQFWRYADFIFRQHFPNQSAIYFMLYVYLNINLFWCLSYANYLSLSFNRLILSYLSLLHLSHLNLFYVLSRNYSNLKLYFDFWSK